jgi:hypothetical protein
MDVKNSARMTIRRDFKPPCCWLGLSLGNADRIPNVLGAALGRGSHDAK